MKDSIRSLIRAMLPPAVERGLRRAHHGYKVRRFKPYVKPITVDDVRFDFLVADPIGQASYDLADRRTLTPNLRFIRDHCINEGDVVFDCGAHHGFMAILLSRWTGNTGAVLAFEPIPNNANTIRANVELNRIHNIVVEEKAIGDGAGWAFFSLSAQPRMTPESRAEYRVVKTSLDAYAQLKPHLLVLDVEGAELEALHGAREILRRHPKLVIQVYPGESDRAWQRLEGLLSLLDADAYDFWIQRNASMPPERFDRRAPLTAEGRLYAIPRRTAPRPLATAN
jgi:FkbM family methyltransferase